MTTLLCTVGSSLPRTPGLTPRGLLQLGLAVVAAAAGAELLAKVAESRQAALRERLRERPAEDITRFAVYLERYNAGQE